MIKPLVYHFFLLVSGLDRDDQQPGGAGDGGAQADTIPPCRGWTVEQVGLVLDKDEEQLLAR